MTPTRTIFDLFQIGTLSLNFSSPAFPSFAPCRHPSSKSASTCRTEGVSVGPAGISARHHGILLGLFGRFWGGLAVGATAMAMGAWLVPTSSCRSPRVNRPRLEGEFNSGRRLVCRTLHYDQYGLRKCLPASNPGARPAAHEPSSPRFWSFSSSPRAGCRASPSSLAGACYQHGLSRPCPMEQGRANRGLPGPSCNRRAGRCRVGRFRAAEAEQSDSCGASPEGRAHIPRPCSSLFTAHTHDRPSLVSGQCWRTNL